MTNLFTRNRKFNYLLGMLNNAIGVEDWDYWARELDKLIGEIRYKEYNKGD